MADCTPQRITTSGDVINDLLDEIARLERDLAQALAAAQQPADGFDEWVARAYRDPEQSNFTIHNMEVAYRAGRESTQPPAGWREALEFYAERHHFAIADDNAWDTVSGEPQNFWCDEAGTATVEDGTVAAMALRGTPLTDEEEDAPKATKATATQPPAGYVTVPVEPTEEMIAHAHQACDGTYAGDVYHVMLAAAPRGDTPATNPALLVFKTLMAAQKAEPVQQPEQTLLNIGREIGFGRAQQILGEQWEAEHGCAPRGRMGVTVRDSAKASYAPREPLTDTEIAHQPQDAELPDVEDMAHSAVQEALSCGLNHDVIHRWMRAVMDKTVAALAAQPQEAALSQELTLFNPRRALEIFKTAQAGSSRDVGTLRGIMAILSDWESRPDPHGWLVPSQDAEDSARLDWLEQLADGFTFPNVCSVVGVHGSWFYKPVGGHQIERKSLREIIDAARAKQITDSLGTEVFQDAEGTKPVTAAGEAIQDAEDAARLDWLLLHVSGSEFRRIGVQYSGNVRRADVDAARAQQEKM